MCIPTGIKIRKAVTADASAIAALKVRALRAQSTPDTEHEINALVEETDLLDAIALADGQYAVADFGGYILACGGWSSGQSRDEGLISGIFVDEGFTSAGLGTRVLRTLEAEILASGRTRVSVHTAYTGLPFFQHMGYRPSRLISDVLPSGIEIHGVELKRTLGVTAGKTV